MELKKDQFLKALRPIMVPVYQSIGKLINIGAPCKDCGHKEGSLGEVIIKLQTCPKCGRIITAGTSDIVEGKYYAWVR
jgi:predicted Zn-ribbon and HTH transcriptional regulator